MIYVPECGLPPPIECIRRRCCVTDRTWASALPFLFCATLATSKFGVREWRASRGPPRYPGSPFRCVGRAPRSGGHAPDAGCLRHPHPNATLFGVVIVPADGTRAATVKKRRLRYVAAFVGQLSDKTLLASILLTGVSERIAQWRIEKLRADPIR